MLVVRGSVSKHAALIGAVLTCLGRWNFIDLVNRVNKVRIISLCQCVKYKSTMGTAYSQRRRYFLARKIDACPRKLCILHLTQFMSDSMSSGFEVKLTVDSNAHVVKDKLAK